MTERLLVSSAPVFEVEGRVVGELARDLMRLEVEEDTAGLKTLTARLLAHGPEPGSSEEAQLYLDGATLDFGKPLAVSIGPDHGARTIFRGFVSALEAKFQEEQEPEVVLFAEDQFMKLRMTRRSKSYEDVTDAQIAEAIAAEHGFNVDADADGPGYDVVQQWNMSDLAFLRQRARLIQAELWFQEDTLHFKTREKRTGTELTLVQGNHIIHLEARADLAHQRTAVRVSGYDANQRDVIDEQAGPEAIDAEVAGGRTGLSIVEWAFGRAGFLPRPRSAAGRRRSGGLGSSGDAAPGKRICSGGRNDTRHAGLSCRQPPHPRASRPALQRSGILRNSGPPHV